MYTVITAINKTDCMHISSSSSVTPLQFHSEFYIVVKRPPLM